MRQTQFMGLTRAAQNFVVHLEELPSDTNALGMFMEEIPLRRWEVHPCLITGTTKTKKVCIREVVQCTPWSGGPMIFTQLAIDYGNGAKIPFHQWIDDPLLGREEFDQASGRKWV